MSLQEIGSEMHEMQGIWEKSRGPKKCSALIGRDRILRHLIGSEFGQVILGGLAKGPRNLFCKCKTRFHIFCEGGCFNMIGCWDDWLRRKSEHSDWLWESSDRKTARNYMNPVQNGVRLKRVLFEVRYGGISISIKGVRMFTDPIVESNFRKN